MGKNEMTLFTVAEMPYGQPFFYRQEALCVLYPDQKADIALVIKDCPSLDLYIGDRLILPMEEIVTATEL